MLITRAQLAKELKITTKWLDDCRKLGRLPDYEPGTKLFDRAKALAAWSEWQAEVNDEDEGSQEYLASVLRLWHSRVELSKQKSIALQQSLMYATEAEGIYNKHRELVRVNLEQWAEEAAAKIDQTMNIIAVASALTDTGYAAMDRILNAPADTTPAPEAASIAIDAPDTLDIKKAIERAKTSYNHSEAEIRELKAKIVSGELLLYSDVLNVASERVGTVRINFLAQPARQASALVGRVQSINLHKLKEVAGQLMVNLPAWDVADFRPDAAVIAGLKSELKEQPKGDEKIEEKEAAE
jgi:hypothetical protein